ncbi:MAG: symmetrical bis(5'-nucleosyl)-tetraphosphatase [Methylohalobius sp. ZOD2]
MAHYAIGDIQGCFFELQQLLDKINFDPATDQLWFAGDLVNRGPHSLETLRFVKALGDRAVSVLGNHDLHLLALAYNQSSKGRRGLADVLEAPDRDDLIDWLRHRPLFHHNERFCLVHAGLPPQWDIDTTIHCAREVEAVLQGDEVEAFMGEMYGNVPDLWSEDLVGWDRLRFIVNCFTRLRYCDSEGRLVLEPSGPPEDQPQLIPWLRFPGRKSKDREIVFGHWSTLGFVAENGCYGIDTGCLWGGQLTALRLDGDMYRVSIDCPRHCQPG